MGARHVVLLFGVTGCDVTFGLVDVNPSAGLGPWGVPVVEKIAFTGASAPTLTGDMLEVYFSRNGDIYVAKRATNAQAWGAPALVPGLDSTALETSPEVSFDGRTMFFGSARPGTQGLEDLMFSTRGLTSTPWGLPQFVPELSSNASDNGGDISSDGREIAYTSSRLGGRQIYSSKRVRVAGTWSAPMPEAELDTAGENTSPDLSQDRMTVYWATTRAGSADLYEASRATNAEPFSNIRPIAEINTLDDDTDPWVSLDGRDIYFVRATQTTSMLMRATR